MTVMEAFTKSNTVPSPLCFLALLPLIVTLLNIRTGQENWQLLMMTM